MCRATGNNFRLAYANSLLGSLAVERGDYGRAEQLDEEGRRLSQTLGDRWNVATQLSNEGTQWALRGDFDRGRSLAEEGLALHRQLGDK